MPLIHGKSNKALQKNIETEMDAHPGKERRAQNLAIAYSIQRRSKKMAKGGMAHMKDDAYCATCNGPCKMALGGAVPGHEHSQDLHRNPGAPAPKPDNRRLPEDEYMAKDMDAPIGSTPRGRQPTDPDAMDSRFTKRMANGGPVEGPTHSKGFNRNPGTPAPKEDDERLPEDEYMAKTMAYGSTPHDRGPRPSPKDYLGVRSGGAFAKGGEVARSIADAIMEKKHRMAEGGMVDLEENSEEEGRSPYDRDNGEAGNEEQYDLSQLDDQPEDSNEEGDEREDSRSDPRDRISQIRARMRSIRR